MNRDTALATVLVVTWSSGFVGAELGTRSASGHAVLAWRFVVAALLLGLVVLVRRRRAPGPALRRQAALGVLMQCLYLGGIYTGVEYGVSAGLSALIAALQPMVVAALAAAFLGRRIGPRAVTGLLLGIVGVAVVVGGALGGAAPWWAYALTVGGTVSLSVGTLLQSRVPDRVPVTLGLAVQSATAAVFFLAWSVVAGDAMPPADGPFWFAVGWTVLLSTFLAIGSYLVVIARRGATAASALLYLTPPVTMIWAWAMFDDALGVATVIGLVLCAVAVALVLRPTGPGREADSGAGAGTTYRSPATADTAASS
ncbi:DMT family transporter [Rhodococcoides corynebacterioides]|uniref:DMT family transporter n=1 Tax=Rhodococcoides corynebacterioides TaxID=53972 RepID=A0ABS7P699_9NOCA|nr:DMT family transporter [Rhodococcus corynebacterioides]MBY6367953.1 DMT family transporter [Rhodococcus corynebacterioides]MBY6409419.1 DMT family transporter [Rhodococcus corynebacterioides]